MGNRYLVLNAAEEAVLLKEQRGKGGFQAFMTRLQRQYRRGTQELGITPKDLADIPKYAFDYEDGGWETDLKDIFARHLGPNLGRDR